MLPNWKVSCSAAESCSREIRQPSPTLLCEWRWCVSQEHFMPGRRSGMPVRGQKRTSGCTSSCVLNFRIELEVKLVTFCQVYLIDWNVLGTCSCLVLIFLLNLCLHQRFVQKTPIFSESQLLLCCRRNTEDLLVNSSNIITFRGERQKVSF